MKISGTFSVSLVAFLLAFCGFAETVTLDQARTAVGNWLGAGNALDRTMSRSVESARTLTTQEGATVHVVRLEGGGFVITSGDTRIEPVVAYSPVADLDEDERNPLWALIRMDLARRTEQIAETQTQNTMLKSAARPTQTPEIRWRKLISPPLRGSAAPVSEPADVRVAPLVKSKWGQSTTSGPCFNFYTPKGYPCGCAATAMAQVMRYHCFPNTVEPQALTCMVDYVKTELTMKGGAYDWDRMTLVPMDATEEEREAIGKLTYDCGVTLRMRYASSVSGSVGAFAHDPLLKIFGYASARGYLKPWSAGGVPTATLQQAMHPNFDAGYPVMLSICANYGFNGHEVVADGYGYSDSVLYTHLNMGWNGADDVWYNLPEIKSPTQGYSSSIVDGVTYNVFPDKTGDIFSGRITDASGKPVAGAKVTIRNSDGGEMLDSAVTGENGIYAFILEGDKSYVATASKDGRTATSAAVNLPKSGNPIWVSFENQNYDNDEMVCGNSWGNDIALEKATPATAEVPVTVAYSWLKQYYPAVPESGYPALVKTSSANGRPVWQSYLLGLDPIDAESEFRITSFEMKNGEPIIKLNVDDVRLDSFGYECRIKGKTYLTDLDWMEQLSGQRYFKAFVEPK